MQITILGAGYVGLTTAALLANAGYDVTVVEPNPGRLATIQQGRSFFFEEGLDSLIKESITNGSLRATNLYTSSVSTSDIVFSCVGTPDNPDGSTNLTYVFAAAAEAIKYMQPGAIYVQKSTVPVGTGERIKQLFQDASSNISYISNPEFLREGTAVYDTLYFDRVVVGGDSIDSIEKVLSVYRELERCRDEIAKRASIPSSNRAGQYISTDLNSAELIKVTSNAFLALKISFANSIAKLSDKVGADIIDVMDAVGADQRIGRAFLDAGRGYGGGCFPKDVSGLISSALDHGIDMEIMSAAQRINESMPGYIVEKLQETIGYELRGIHIAVLGLSFKPNTSDVRRSPGVTIANLLHKLDASVTTYDPKAAQEADGDLRKGITTSASLGEAINKSEIIIIATAWDEIINYDFMASGGDFSKRIIVDATNKINKNNIGYNNTYIGVGR